MEVRANRRGPVGGLLKVEDASSLVGVEAGFFDDIIESAAITDFLEGKLGVCFIGGNQGDGADTEEAIEEAAA